MFDKEIQGITQNEIQTAVCAVEKAMLLAKAVQSEMAGEAMTKGDRSPVTVADFAIQAFVGSILKTACPEEALVAEESSTALRKTENQAVLDKVLAFVKPLLPDVDKEKIFGWIDHGMAEPTKRFWTLDPVDGTKGFLRGDHYAVALALVENGNVLFSVLGCPHLDADDTQQNRGLGSLTVAVKGGGAWITPIGEGKPLAEKKIPDDFRQLRVSSCSKVSELRMLRSVEASHTNVDRVGKVLESLGIRTPPVLMDSQAKYAALASARADVFFYLVSVKNPNFRMKIWDVAPGWLVVEEAGGQITDVEGKDLDFTRGRTLADNPGLVITNKHLHSVVLEALTQIEN